jgi:hypothetical protein
MEQINYHSTQWTVIWDLLLQCLINSDSTVENTVLHCITLTNHGSSSGILNCGAKFSIRVLVPLHQSKPSVIARTRLAPPISSIVFAKSEVGILVPVASSFLPKSRDVWHMLRCNCKQLPEIFSLKLLRADGQRSVRVLCSTKKKIWDFVCASPGLLVSGNEDAKCAKEERLTNRVASTTPPGRRVCRRVA